MKTESLTSLGLAVCVLAVCVIACDSSTNKNSSPPATPAATGQATPPANQGATVSAAPAATPAAIHVKGPDLLRDYRKNEVAADDKYKGKLVEVDDIVSDIQAGALSGAWLNLSGGSLRAGFEDAEKGPVAKLQKNQRVTVVCTCNGLTLGTLFLRDCSLK
jgi:hypothetical protein